MTPESEKVFVDTNILIYSTFEDFEPDKHVQCADTLNKLHQSGTILFISSQILREYFAVSTNRNIFKKPLTYKQAVSKMKEFIARFTLVHEKESTIHILITLIGKYAVSRQKIHDMNIVATMVDNDITHLLTYNVQDFKQISEIQLLP
jgi:Predicted nucleic acid-binding protein, contains PIN domain